MKLGNWEIATQLVKGRWSSIFSASATGQDRYRNDFVVKTINPNSPHADWARLMLHREFACANLVDHPNLISFLDFGPDTTQPYLVSARINGVSLATALETGENIGLPEKLMYFRQICEAVRALHRRGIRHGDLSPSNIMIDRPTGKVTVLDLGLSEFVNPFKRSSYLFAGTWGYIAPECIQGHDPVNVSADIYSLGAILNEFCFNAETSVSSDELQQLARQMLDSNPLRRPTIDAVLQSLVMLEVKSFNVSVAA